MKIVWDEPKRQANLAKHRLDFATLDEGFFRNAPIADAKHGRFQALGRCREIIVVVIFGRLGSEAISVVSMRRANAREQREL